MNPVILKIGGSVITEKSNASTAKQGEIGRIANEIASFKSKSDLNIILVHGAGSFGHPQASKWANKFDARGVCETHASVKALNSMVVESLNCAGINALPVHPLSSCLLDNGKIVVFHLEQVKLMLKNGIMPVLHGDVVMDKALGATVLSGDRIVPYLALALKASKIGAGSNVDGVLDGKGELIKKITPFNFLELEKHIKGSISTDVTGGMLGKVSEFLELADKGISSRIFNASKKGMVSRFLQGEDVGTLIANK